MNYEPPYENIRSNLREISTDELYKFLQKNHQLDASFLAIISSELLRRQLIQKYDRENYEGSMEKSGEANSNVEDWVVWHLDGKVVCFFLKNGKEVVQDNVKNVSVFPTCGQCNYDKKSLYRLWDELLLALTRANKTCSDDEYDSRLNILLISLAEYIRERDNADFN